MGALPYGVHESFHHVDPVPLVPPHIVVQAVIPDAHRSLSCRKLPTSELGLSVRWGHVIHVICVSPLALPLSSFFLYSTERYVPVHRPPAYWSRDPATSTRFYSFPSLRPGQQHGAVNTSPHTNTADACLALYPLPGWLSPIFRTHFIIIVEKLLSCPRWM